MTERRHISIDPSTQGGAPCISGTRIPVDSLVACVVGRDSCAKVADWYPPLTTEDVRLACWHEAVFGGLLPKKRRKAWDQWAHGDWRHTDPPSVKS